MFLKESTVKKIIELIYEQCEVAGMICELCWLRNFRVGDVRFAKANHFRKENGYPEIFLGYDKMKSNQWYPIPRDIYHKIRKYIINNNIGDDEPVFEITKKRQGVYFDHKGIITHEWIRYLWIGACKELGIYTETVKEIKQCHKCDYALGKNRDGKCSIMYPKIKKCQAINIKYCIRKGFTRLGKETHPRLHETLRGAGAQTKIEYYLDQGEDYEQALLKVFHMSNWKSYKVFKSYLNDAFEKAIGDRTFINDFYEKTLIDV